MVTFINCTNVRVVFDLRDLRFWKGFIQFNSILYGFISKILNNFAAWTCIVWVVCYLWEFYLFFNVSAVNSENHWRQNAALRDSRFKLQPVWQWDTYLNSLHSSCEKRFGLKHVTCFGIASIDFQLLTQRPCAQCVKGCRQVPEQDSSHFSSFCVFYPVSLNLRQSCHRGPVCSESMLHINP